MNTIVMVRIDRVGDGVRITALSGRAKNRKREFSVLTTGRGSAEAQTAVDKALRAKETEAEEQGGLT